MTERKRMHIAGCGRLDGDVDGESEVKIRNVRMRVRVTSSKRKTEFLVFSVNRQACLSGASFLCEDFSLFYA